MPCDGKDDLCLDSLDEDCDEDSLKDRHMTPHLRSEYFFPSNITLMVALAITAILGEIFFCLYKSNRAGPQREKHLHSNIENELFQLFLKNTVSISSETFLEFKKLHNSNEYSDVVADSIRLASYVYPNKATNQTYFELESAYHDENELEALLCIKNKLGTDKNSMLLLKLIKPESKFRRMIEKVRAFVRTKLIHSGCSLLHYIKWYRYRYLVLGNFSAIALILGTLSL